MRALIQRVAWAEVEVDGAVIGRIDRGLLVYVAAAPGDTDRQVQWLSDKVVNLRIFEDGQGKMNRCVRDARGGVLVVTNFTLMADAQKGRRPSFIGAARPEEAEPLTERFVKAIAASGVPVASGRFGAMMAVRSQADGPVNVMVDAPAVPGS
ncbi:MAG: D-aminoacyl-tRNA deacylase [Planctomycetota bacterium]